MCVCVYIFLYPIHFTFNNFYKSNTIKTNYNMRNKKYKYNVKYNINALQCDMNLGVKVNSVTTI